MVGSINTEKKSVGEQLSESVIKVPLYLFSIISVKTVRYMRLAQRTSISFSSNSSIIE